MGVRIPRKLAVIYFRTRYLIIILAIIMIPFGLYVADKKDKGIKHGSELAEQGNYAGAIEEYNKVVEIVPNNRRVYIFRGDAYMHLGKYDLALADLNKSVELNPDSSKGYFYRAIVYYITGKFDLAIADIQKTKLLEEKNTTPFLSYYIETFQLDVPAKLDSDKKDTRSQILAILNGKST